jgi:hypothetical protein
MHPIDPGCSQCIPHSKPSQLTRLTNPQTAKQNKTKQKKVQTTNNTFLTSTMKLSNTTFAAALVALLASPTMATTTAKATATAELNAKNEESSFSTALYDLFSSIGVSPKVELEVVDDEESPSADANYGRKKDRKTMGKFTMTSTTALLAMDPDSDEPNTLALAFLQDALLYTYNEVQEGSDLQGVGSHLLGTVVSPEGPDGGDALFPELSKSLRGSVSWRTSVYRG